MFMEGFLSTLVIVSIGAFGYSVLGSEISQGLSGSTDAFSSGYLEAIGTVGGPVGIFSKSFAMASKEALGLPVEFMIILASMWVASFAMTTLDSTNRIARYTLAEILDPIREKAPSLYNILTYRWVASAVPAFLGIALAWSGAWSIIWPAFGGANQLLASIAMITGAVWVRKINNTKAWNVLIPALFIWVTVTLALIWYIVVAIPTFMATSPVQAGLLSFMIVIMVALNLLLNI